MMMMMGGREGVGAYVCGGWRLEGWRLACWLLARCLIGVGLQVAALGEVVGSGLRGSRFVWAGCLRLSASWSAVLNREYACGLCTLRSLRLVEVGNGEMKGEWASERCAWG